MTVELLYLPSCPYHAAAAALLREVLDDEGLPPEFTETPIADYEEAMKRGFPGSPTFRVNGRDIEELPVDRLPVGFACRTYFVDGERQGMPPRAWLERAIRTARISGEDRR